MPTCFCVGGGGGSGGAEHFSEGEGHLPLDITADEETEGVKQIYVATATSSFLSYCPLSFVVVDSCLFFFFSFLLFSLLFSGFFFLVPPSTTFFSFRLSFLLFFFFFVSSGLLCCPSPLLYTLHSIPFPEERIYNAFTRKKKAKNKQPSIRGRTARIP